MKTRAAVLSIGLFLVVLLSLVTTTTVRAGAPPIFNNQTMSIAENSPNGSSAANVTYPSDGNKLRAVDPEGSALTFTILGGSGMGVFAVASPSGAVTVTDSSQLDYEATKSFTLTVEVEDNEALTKTATVTINLTDVSDQAPSMSDQTFEVPENSNVGTVVGTLVYNDLDVNDTFSFTILSGTGLGVFSIDSTGKITVANKAALDYETTKKFEMNVKITDAGGQNDTALVTVNVSDVNENPVISPQTFNISEGAANNAVVGTVAASDPENEALTFSILTLQSTFAIGSSSGQLTVADNTQLDFETKPTVNLLVQVQDAFGKTSSASMTINVTNVNDKPKTTGIADVVVNQGAPNTVISLWAAFSDDEDPDSALEFSVQNNTNPGLFDTPPAVNNANGTLTLDYKADAAGVANITIRAIDTQDAFTDTTFKVDINDAPVAVGIANFTVNEDAANSQVDLYDAFDDAEDPDSALQFQVVSNTNPGLFTPPLLISGQFLVLDYAPNANGNATITVKATDTGGLSAQTSFKVTVAPVNDQPTTTGIANVNVQEDAPNTVINLFAAFVDIEDADPDLDYEVVENSNTGLFDAVTLDGAAGTLTLDYKANTSGVSNMKVRATDTGKLSVDAAFTVTVGSVNDAPVVADFSKTTDEDIPVNFTAADFTSHYSDADSDPLAQIRIDALPADGTLKLSGVDIVLNQAITAANLGNLSFVPANNWDQGSTTFDWSASDGTAYSAEPATVTITVKPVNDPPTVSNFTKVGVEGLEVTFSQSDFVTAFNDVDGQTLQVVRIITLPANGTLRRGTTPVAANEQINIANLGQLNFVPNDNWSGDTTFNWNGSDGSLYATAPATVTLSIAPVNDPPSIDLNGPAAGTDTTAIFVAGRDPVAIIGPDLTITDVDSTEMSQATVIIVNRKNGAKEILSADTTGTNIEANFSTASGVLFLTGPDTIANFVKVLKTVKFAIEADVTNPDPTPRNISVRVNDGGANSNDATSTVSVINPRIELTVTPEFQTVIKGTTAVFTVSLKNTGDVTLNNIQVTSDKVPDCNRSYNSLGAGQSVQQFACIVSNVTDRVDNLLKVTATDAQVGTQVTDESKAVVRVLQDIIIDIAPDPSVGSTLIRGQDAKFLVTVINPSEGKLKNVVVEAFVDYDTAVELNATAEKVPAPSCDFAVGDLTAGQVKEYACTIANVQSSFQIEVVAKGTVEGIGPTEDFDIGDVSVLNLTLEVLADPFQVLAGQPTAVTYNMTLGNASDVPLTLTSLQSVAHGNLLDAGNANVTNNTCPTLNVLIDSGAVRTCSYQVTLILQPPAFTNTVTGVANDGAGRELTVSDEAIVSVADFSPVGLLLSADPESLVAPGGTVNITVQVSNNLGTDLTVDALTESVLGDLDGLGTCSLPQVLPGNGTYACTYPITITGQQAGSQVTRTVTAQVDEEQVSDDIAIPITATPSVRILLPSVARYAVAGEPNNSVCDAMAIAPNITNYFMADDANDWYAFSLAESSPVLVKLANYLADGQLVVFSGNCSSPTFLKNNGNYEKAKEIDLGVMPAGSYFVWVLSDSNFNSVSPYSLRVETTGP